MGIFVKEHLPLLHIQMLITPTLTRWPIIIFLSPRAEPVFGLEDTWCMLIACVSRPVRECMYDQSCVFRFMNLLGGTLRVRMCSLLPLTCFAEALSVTPVCPLGVFDSQKLSNICCVTRRTPQTMMLQESPSWLLLTGNKLDEANRGITLSQDSQTSDRCLM